MRKSIAVLVLLFAFPLAAQPTPKQRELIEQLLAAFDAASLIDDNARSLLEPAAVQAAVRTALIDVYASRFTESELAELVAFYNTPVGKKLARVSPELLRESAEKSRAALEPLIRRERERLSPWIGTMNSMRKLASALERYSLENAEYPQTGFAGLKRLLVPKYLDALPEKDSWGNEFYYTASRYGRHYRIVSAGSDGVFEDGSQQIPEDGDHFEETTLTNDPKFDIIHANGSFMQLPRIAVPEE
jgi:hypothetical protein